MIPNNNPGHHTEVINREHYEIHEGMSFSTYTYDAAMNITEEITIAFKTPNTANKLHVISLASSIGGSIFEALEAPTITVDTGADLMVYNRKRDSTNTSGILTIETTPEEGKATLDPTITADGTVLDADLMGSGNTKQGGASRATGEWILEPDTIYAFRVTSLSNSNSCNLKLIWYECDVV